MLGNVVPLWEVMLAAMKLGAVVIPATTLLTPADLADRFARGRARHVDRRRRDRRNSTSIDQRSDPDRGRRRAAGLAALRRRCYGAGAIHARRRDPRRRSAAALFHLRHDRASRSSCCIRIGRYPVGHLSTMYVLGLLPGDIHLNISSPGWAKHAWSCFFAPWNAGATVFIANQPRFNARTCWTRSPPKRHHAVRAADGLAHARSRKT